jgi:hypothetical protein
VDFFLDWYPPNVGELHRTGLTNILCCLASYYLLLILPIVFYVGTMLKHHIPYLLPARRNFNWYQSRHLVLFLDELQGRCFMALWTRNEVMSNIFFEDLLLRWSGSVISAMMWCFDMHIFRGVRSTLFPCDPSDMHWLIYLGGVKLDKIISLRWSVM